MRGKVEIDNCKKIEWSKISEGEKGGRLSMLMIGVHGCQCMMFVCGL